jgi:hypothetical protein
MLARWVPALLFTATLALCPSATARVEATSGYTKAQAFSGALRFLRVDRGYDVLEKDADAAYVLFRYPLPGKQPSASGSVEVVETPRGTKIFVQLPRLPVYHETVLRDALLKKLREEYGTPPPKAKPPEEKPPSEKSPGEDEAPKPPEEKTVAP